MITLSVAITAQTIACWGIVAVQETAASPHFCLKLRHMVAMIASIWETTRKWAPITCLLFQGSHRTIWVASTLPTNWSHPCRTSRRQPVNSSQSWMSLRSVWSQRRRESRPVPPSCSASEVETSLARLEMLVCWLLIQQRMKSNLKMMMTSFSLISVQIVKTIWLASRAQTWRTFWDTLTKESGHQSSASEALCNCSHTRSKTWSSKDRTSSS